MRAASPPRVLLAACSGPSLDHRHRDRHGERGRYTETISLSGAVHRGRAARRASPCSGICCRINVDASALDIAATSLPGDALGIGVSLTPAGLWSMEPNWPYRRSWLVFVPGGCISLSFEA